jgi:hypothetical protein
LAVVEQDAMVPLHGMATAGVVDTDQLMIQQALEWVNMQ